MDYPLWNAKDLAMRSKGNYNDWRDVMRYQLMIVDDLGTEPREESSLSVGLLDLATAPASDPEEDMLAKQYVKKKKKPQRKRGFRL